MKITPEIIRHELIGNETQVVRSSHIGYLRASGRVVDETRNTLTLLDDDRRRIITKESSVFHFVFHDDTKVEIDGKLLIGRPEDRLKKAIRRRW